MNLVHSKSQGICICWFEIACTAEFGRRCRASNRHAQNLSVPAFRNSSASARPTPFVDPVISTLYGGEIVSVSLNLALATVLANLLGTDCRVRAQVTHPTGDSDGATLQAIFVQAPTDTSIQHCYYLCELHMQESGLLIGLRAPGCRDTAHELATAS